MLDEVYGTKISPKSMRPETVFTALSLEGNPGDLKQGPTRIKCFFEQEKPEDYAEFFTNVDVNAHRLEVREKDEEYRKAIIQALVAR